MKKNKKLIKTITLDDIEMRPSPPWITRSKNGIMFTDEIAKESIDLKSEKSSGKGKIRKGEYRYKDFADEKQSKKN